MVFPRALNLRGDVHSAKGELEPAETAYLAPPRNSPRPRATSSTAAESTTQLIGTEVSLAHPQGEVRGLPRSSTTSSSTPTPATTSSRRRSPTPCRALIKVKRGVRGAEEDGADDHPPRPGEERRPREGGQHLRDQLHRELQGRRRGPSTGGASSSSASSKWPQDASRCRHRCAPGCSSPASTSSRTRSTTRPETSQCTHQRDLHRAHGDGQVGTRAVPARSASSST